MTTSTTAVTIPKNFMRTAWVLADVVEGATTSVYAKTPSSGFMGT
jgi:hypothetical protein